jgi:hypothetical protein
MCHNTLQTYHDSPWFVLLFTIRLNLIDIFKRFFRVKSVGPPGFCLVRQSGRRTARHSVLHNAENVYQASIRNKYTPIESAGGADGFNCAAGKRRAARGGSK